MKVQRFLQTYDSNCLMLSPNDTIVAAAEKFTADDQARRTSTAIVLKDDAVVGVLTLSDLAKAISTYKDKIAYAHVGDVMTTTVETAGPEEDIADVLKRMNDQEIRHMPVIEDNRFKGLIARRAIIEALYQDAMFQLQNVSEYVFKFNGRY